MFCTNCAFQLPDGSRFCVQCGARLSPDSAKAAASGLVNDFAQRLRGLASTEELEGFSLQTMFSEVFKKRTPEEMEEHFLTGTSKATPPLDQVETGWPKPWFFFRALAAITIVYLGFYWMLVEFRNPKVIPGLIVMGNLAFPMATLILFFEFNTPRNISMYSIVMMICTGGVVSLGLTHIVSRLADLGWMGMMSAGIVEELAKFLTVAWFARNLRHKYILNGLLLGAAVGAGFEIFEDFGYVFDTARKTMNIDAMADEIFGRGITAPFSHIIWTAISGAAFWRARGAEPLSIKHFVDPAFLRAFLVPVALHMLWDSPLPNPLQLKYAALGLAGWFVVFGFVQSGLKQVRREQRAEARQMLATTRL